MTKVEYQAVPTAESNGKVSEPVPDEVPIPLNFTGRLKRRWLFCSSLFWGSGVFCAAFAAFAFACSSLCVKLVGDGVPAVEIVFVRATMSLMVTIACARAAGIAPILGKRVNLKLLIGRGCCGACAMTSYYVCLTTLPLGDAVTLFFLNPSLTALVAFVVLHEPLGWLGAGGVVTSLGGMVLLSSPPFIFGGASWSQTRVLGTLLGLVAAMFSAGAFMFMRLLSGREPPLVLTMYFYIISIIVCLGPMAAGWPGPAVMPTAAQWGLLLCVSGASFMGQICLTRSFQLLAAAKASGINFTQVVYSYGFGILFLHESITPHGAVGAVLIAGGAALVNVRPAGKKADSTAAPEDCKKAPSSLCDSEDAMHRKEGIEGEALVKGALESVGNLSSERSLDAHVVLEMPEVTRPKSEEQESKRDREKERLLKEDLV